MSGFKCNHTREMMLIFLSVSSLDVSCTRVKLYWELFNKEDDMNFFIQLQLSLWERLGTLA